MNKKITIVIYAFTFLDQVGVGCQLLTKDVCFEMFSFLCGFCSGIAGFRLTDLVVTVNILDKLELILLGNGETIDSFRSKVKVELSLFQHLDGYLFLDWQFAVILFELIFVYRIFFVLYIYKVMYNTYQRVPVEIEP